MIGENGFSMNYKMTADGALNLCVTPPYGPEVKRDSDRPEDKQALIDKFVKDQTLEKAEPERAWERDLSSISSATSSHKTTRSRDDASSVADSVHEHFGAHAATPSPPPHVKQEVMINERSDAHTPHSTHSHGSRSPFERVAQTSREPSPNVENCTSPKSATPAIAQLVDALMPPNTQFGQHGLQHVQHLLQQQFIKQHAAYMNHPSQTQNGGQMKQLEQTLQQLQDQLRLNLYAQSDMMRSEHKKRSAAILPQLAMQHQHILQQIQLTQQQYLMQQGMAMQPLMMQPPAQGNQFIATRDTISPWNDPEMFASKEITTGPRDEAKLSPHEQTDKLHPLYAHDMCRWPGCDARCNDVNEFLKHLNTEHVLDDRSTAQARVQMQVVSQLEVQLQKEKDRLQAMMYHLHVSKRMMSVRSDMKSTSAAVVSADVTPVTTALTHVTYTSNSLNSSNSQADSPLLSQPNVPASNMIASPAVMHMTPSVTTAGGPVRRRTTDKTSLSIAGGLPYMLERAGLDVQQEIQRNREFYKNADVRPPFTYASLIRQSIIESPDKQLTLNEIYNWFQSTFCYFRRNAATWKNAIRTNLSLHKCFVRYEDDFGSFWMVDDAEFVKRRHLSRGRPRKYDPNPSASPRTSPPFTTNNNSSTQQSSNKRRSHSPMGYDALAANLHSAMIDDNNMNFMPSMISNKCDNRRRSESPKHRSNFNGSGSGSGNRSTSANSAYNAFQRIQDGFSIKREKFTHDLDYDGNDMSNDMTDMPSDLPNGDVTETYARDDASDHETMAEDLSMATSENID